MFKLTLVMRFESFFTGHKASVLALAGNPKEPFFFSVGADGLVVRWNVHNPDEGDVIIRLNGIVPSMTYDKQSNCLYAVLNQKGILEIDHTKRKSELIVPLPSTSFNKLVVSGRYGIASAKGGELILFELKEKKIIDRIQTGLESTPQFILDEAKLWHYGTQGFDTISWDENGFKRSDSIHFKEDVCMTSVGKYIWASEEDFLHMVDMKKQGKIFTIETKHGHFIKLLGSKESGFMVALLKSGDLVTIETSKKNALVGQPVQKEHNGAINDLLWSENYTFVITAGRDKKIGVWRFN